jgi:putative endonuclease
MTDAEPDLVARIERHKRELRWPKSPYHYRMAMCRLGEALAEQYYVQRGAVLLQRNWRSRWGELDLVLLFEDALVAVEVKTRLAGNGWRPEDAMTRVKLTRLGRLLGEYALQTMDHWMAWRIDVMAVELRRDGSVVRMDHYRAA